MEQNMILAIVAGLVLVGGAIVLLSQPAFLSSDSATAGDLVGVSNTDSGASGDSGVMVKDSDAMDKGDASGGSGVMVKDEGSAVNGAPGGAAGANSDAPVAGGSDGLSSGRYSLYSKAAFEAAQADRKLIFLEFSATWCPFCQAQKPVLEDAFRDASLPENVVAFEVPYQDARSNSDSQAMIQRYQVGMQHTHVILASDGRVVTKATGQWTKEEILAALSNANVQAEA